MNRKKSAPFLEAILESPDDDAVRLVFADFLEENGEPERAEFIRIQIAHHQLNEYDPRRRILGYRIDALLKRFGTKWRAELPKLDGVIWAHFQRGFVHAVYVTNPDVLAECADTIVDASPVDTLILGGGDESMEWSEIDESPWVRRLFMWSDDGLMIEDVERFAECPLLKHIELLNLDNLNLDDDWFRTFFSTTPYLRKLRELSVSHNYLDADGLEAVSTSKYLRNLKSLNVGGGGDVSDGSTLESTGARIIAESETFMNLEKLSIHSNRIGMPGFRAILESRHLRKLRDLNVMLNEIGPDVESLRGLKTPIRLERLSFSNNRIGGNSFARSAEIPVFSELKSLVLTDCGLGWGDMQSLQEAPFWPHLRELYLANNALGIDGANILAHAPVGNLQFLHLGESQIGSEGAKHLAYAPFMQSVMEVYLQQNSIASDGVMAMSSSPFLTNLHHLDLSDNHIDESGWNAIARSKLPSSLRQLHLTKNKLWYQSLIDFESADWPELSELSLEQCGLHIDQVRAIFGGRFPNLAFLNLANNELGADLVDALADCPWMIGVAELNLTRNDIGDSGMEKLATSEVFANLVKLNVWHAKIGDAGFRALCDSTTLRSLVWLSYSGNKCEPGTRERLESKFGYPEENIPG